MHPERPLLDMLRFASIGGAIGLIAYSILVLLLMLFSPRAIDAQTQLSLGQTFPLTIVTDHGPRRFEVWVADTPEKRTQGLMFQTDIPTSGGMLFPFEEEHLITMWMKNTPRALDMIFIDSGHTIVDIAHHAMPYSTEIIAPQAPARYVLEVVAGTARQEGIKPGMCVVLPDGL